MRFGSLGYRHWTRAAAILSIVIATAGVLAALPAIATTFYPVPFKDSVRDAPTIIRGTVGRSEANWAKADDGTRRIYTFYDVQVTEVLKGEVDGSSLTMREMGGMKDGLGLQVSGASHFEQAEDVVVFLGSKNSDGSYDVRGMMMGKFNIVKDASGKETLAGPALSMDSEAQEHGHDHGQDGSGAKKGTSETWTLEKLRRVISEQAALAPAEKSEIKQPVSTPNPAPTATAGTSEQAAPALQTSSSEMAAPSVEADAEGAKEGGFPGPVAIALGLLGVLAALGILWSRLTSQRGHKR